MFSKLLKSTVDTVPIDRCCCCFPHRLGIAALGVVYVALTIITYGVTTFVIWTADEKSVQRAIDSSDEIKALFYELKEYRLSFVSSLILNTFVHLLSFISSLLLAYGAAARNWKCFLPWIVMTKLSICILLITAIIIIFLEKKLFGTGSSVFGLFSLVCLFVAFTIGYLLIVVLSFQERLLACTEDFKRWSFDAEFSSVGTFSVFPDDVPMQVLGNRTM